MVFEEQISAFIDGALTAGEETEFLHILSVSPEKRELFHSYMGVHNTLAADIRQTSVPAHLDAAVFAAAGVVAAGVAGATTVTAASTAGSAVAAWTVGKLAGITLIALALLSGGYFAGSMMSSTSEEATGSTAESTVKPVALTDPGRMPDSRSATKEGSFSSLASQGASRSGTTAGRERIIYRNIYVTRVDTMLLPATNAILKTETVFDTVYIAQAEMRTPEREIVYIEGVQEQQPRPSLPGNVEIELQSEHITTYPYIDYGVSGTARNQQHFSVFASYGLDEHHAIGLMAGQRAYSLEYYEVVGDSMFLFQEQPTQFYGGGFYRYSLPVFAGVTPEFQIQLGGTQLGPLVGSRVAVKLTPFQHLSLTVGVNGSMLIYGYKQQLFTSQTLGFIYGLQYRF